MKLRLLGLLVCLGLAAGFAWGAGSSYVVVDIIGFLKSNTAPIIIKADTTFEGNVVLEVPPVVLYGLQISTYSASELRSIVCSADYCVVYNIDDDDLYTSTGPASGDWRNTRTGYGP